MPSYNPLTAASIAALRQIVGERNVITDEDKLQPYSHDEETDSHYHHLPEAVVFPVNVEQVAAIVKLANRELVPVVPRGAGTGLACGAVPVYGGIVLSLEKMNKIIEINTDSLYMIVEPGVRTEDVQKAAQSAGLFYAGDPCSGDSCFIGGNVATNAGGNRAVKYGTTRHQVYAIEVVNPCGEIVRLGGRIEKVSTGYCLEQLIIGSEGTLGVITQIILRLKPLPHHVVDLLAIFPDVDSAIGIVGKISKAGVVPTCLEFMDNITVRSIERFLQEKLPGSDMGHYLIIQVEGKDQDELDDKSVLLDELCTANGAHSVLVADPQRIWKARKSYTEAVRQDSLIISKEDLVVPLDRISQMMQIITAMSERHGMATRIVSHAGDGNIHLNILKCDLDEAAWNEKLTAFQQELYPLVYEQGGKLSGEHGIGSKRKKLMQQVTAPAELAMMRAIKKALDPNLILNPGKLFDPE